MFAWYLLMNNFQPAQPSACVICAIDEIDNVFADFGIELEFGQAIDNEMLATEVVEKVISDLTASI